MTLLAEGVPAKQQLREILKREDSATLEQFAAANASRVGHVHGALATPWVPDLMVSATRKCGGTQLISSKPPTSLPSEGYFELTCPAIFGSVET
ncbi:hypothetical protein [Burkholderia sp. Ac-20379]|uniref:hypothetical protein n=1 Tax=Burkholderia sp. Ac-20379 TaxID=2703900 RepID=UPI00197D65CA|nr:hypothetical protein [Burkholderia sp. Ac-20379]